MLSGYEGCRLQANTQAQRNRPTHQLQHSTVHCKIHMHNYNNTHMSWEVTTSWQIHALMAEHYKALVSYQVTPQNAMKPKDIKKGLFLTGTGFESKRHTQSDVIAKLPQTFKGEHVILLRNWFKADTALSYMRDVRWLGCRSRTLRATEQHMTCHSPTHSPEKDRCPHNEVLPLSASCSLQEVLYSVVTHTLLAHALTQ